MTTAFDILTRLSGDEFESNLAEVLEDAQARTMAYCKDQGHLDWRTLSDEQVDSITAASMEAWLTRWEQDNDVS